MSLVFKGILGIITIGIVGTTAIGGIAYRNHINQPSPPPKVNFIDVDNRPTGSSVPETVKKVSETASDVVTCTFNNLPAVQMRSSECDEAVDCQIGDKWYYYKNNSECDKDQEAYIKGQIKAPRYSAPSMTPLNIAPPSLAPYSTAPFPSVQAPSVNIQAPASPKTAPYGYGNFN